MANHSFSCGRALRDLLPAAKLTHINDAFGHVAPDPALPGAPITCQSGDLWADDKKPWTAEQSVDGIDVTAA